ncbi:hypothetical protein L596_019648 [Steinernema carpocapsae]|uniref:Uncharacterized protein n=1 Tax=Steinernema carpocapsae TaxID=34508 RepID=A0A4U5MR54_STECR|nr:hypothetical protein L596_019648 [Steinernema carpocapsae]
MLGPAISRSACRVQPSIVCELLFSHEPTLLRSTDSGTDILSSRHRRSSEQPFNLESLPDVLVFVKLENSNTDVRMCKSYFFLVGFASLRNTITAHRTLLRSLVHL